VNNSDDGEAPVEVEDRLATLLVKAAEESSPEVLTAFFNALLEHTFLVPERQQDTPLKDPPPYPDPFLNVLGVQIKDSIFVPMFSSEERLAEWSGHSIRTRQLTLAGLISLLPTGWWLIINPASEGEKELSPWEIELLSGGAANIPALIEEILVEDVIQDISFSPVAASEFTELREKLKEKAASMPEVQKLFLVRETGKTVSEKEISALILGVLTPQLASARREEIQEQFGALGAYTLIGAEKLKVRVGDSIDGNLMLGIFSGHESFFSAKSDSFLTKLKKLF
jgi:hypothetical protein